MSASQFFSDWAARQPGAYRPQGPQYFDQFMPSRRRPTDGNYAFAAAPRRMGQQQRPEYQGGMIDWGTGQMTTAGLNRRDQLYGSGEGARQFFDNQAFHPPMARGGVAQFAGYSPADQQWMAAGHDPNAGLRNAVDAMHAQNMAIANRPSGPSYFQRQMAGANSGVNFGQQQQAPMPQSGPGYLERMAPAWFGGATPGMVAHSSGMQQGFLGAPQNLGMGGTPESMAAADYGLRQKGYINTGGQWRRSSSSEMPQAQQNAQAMFDARRGGLAQRQADFQQRNFFDMAGRQAGVQQQAMARSDARRMRTGNLSMGEQAMFGIPGYANQQLQNANSSNWMGLQGQMFGQKQAMEHQNNQWAHAASLIQAIPQLVTSGAMTPEQGRAAHAQAMGMMGMRIPGGDSTGAPQNSTDAVKRIDDQVRVAVPQQVLTQVVTEPSKAKRDAMLTAAGITDPKIRSRVHQQANIGQPGHDQFGAPSRKFGWAHGVNDIINSWTGGGTMVTPSGQRVRVVNGQMTPVGPAPGESAPSGHMWGMPSWGF